MITKSVVWQANLGVRSPLCAAFVVAAAMVLGLACAGNEERPPASPSSMASAAPETPYPAEVRDLIATPQTSFEVEFVWDQGDGSGVTKTMSWRQGGGVRRRDAQLTNDTGSFDIQTDFPGASVVGNRIIGCDWYRPPNADEVRIACVPQTASLGLLMAALDAALNAGRISGPAGGREIAGAQAVCYEFEAVAAGEFCTDGNGVPLYFKGAFRDGLRVQTIEARRVSRDGPAPVIPENLPFTDIPYKAGPSYPLARLYLPN